MNTALFALRVRLPLLILVGAETIPRAEFLQAVWQELIAQDLAPVGVDEGMVLAEAAHDLGLETESWTIDSGEAPRERDWVGDQAFATVTFYWSTLAHAKQAESWFMEQLSELGGATEFSPIEEIPPQDWNAEWKKAFRELAQGIAIPPFWRIQPAWEGSDLASLSRKTSEVPLGINPGAGFGTGTHETTQLCLRLLGERRSFLAGGARVLDFGSGSGILGIGAALLGAKVDAVEIDELAIANALENAAMNGVSDKVRTVRHFSELADRGPYTVVVANILRPVLLQFCSELVSRVSRAANGSVILSGLVEDDLRQIIPAFEMALEVHWGRAVQVQTAALGDWRALAFN